MFEYSSNVLIEFDTIVDTDIGLIRTIDKWYCDKNIFFSSVTSMDDTHLKGLLQRKTTMNPLQVILKDESDIEGMNSLYTKFIAEEYNNILKYSALTSMYDSTILFVQTRGTIGVNVLCRNDKEESLLKEIFKDFINSITIVRMPDNKRLNVSKYSEIFVKNIFSLISFDELEGKNIFIANMVGNYDQPMYELAKTIVPNKTVGDIYGCFNIIRFFTLYDYDNSYFFDSDNVLEVEVQDKSVKCDLSNNDFITSIFSEIPSTLDIDQHENEESEEEEGLIPAREKEESLDDDWFDPLGYL